MASYKTEAEALAAAGVPGWTVTGRQRGQETIPNPSRTTSADPATITRDNGETILTVQSPDGTEHDSITIGSVPSPGGKGDEISVVKGAANTHKSTAQTPLSEWDRLDKNGAVIKPDDKTTVATAIRDPKAPPGTPPYTLQGGGELGDPSTWTPITVEGRTVGLYDPQSKKVAASVAAGGSKPSDPTTWTPVYRTPGEKASGIVGQYDPVNSELHPVATQADGKQIVTVPGQGVYSYDKDTDKLNLLQALDKNATLQVVTYPDGSIYTIDPNEKDPSKQLTKLQGNQPPQTMVQHTPGGDLTLLYDPETKTYKPPPGVTPPLSVDANTTALKKIIWRNAATGEVISERDNPNYVAPQTTQGATSTTARQIQQWNDKTGQWDWVENKGRVVASQALHDMAEQLTHQVVAGDISQDEAVALINAANAKMTNDIAQQQNQRGAAGDILSNAASNAQTGAGMLNQRVSSATSALSNMMGTIGSSKITDIPSDFGKNLVGGLSNWVTNMGGGDAVYETAARMVQGADPKISRRSHTRAAGDADARADDAAVPDAERQAVPRRGGDASGETVAKRERRGRAGDDCGQRAGATDQRRRRSGVATAAGSSSAASTGAGRGDESSRTAGQPAGQGDRRGADACSDAGRADDAWSV